MRGQDNQDTMWETHRPPQRPVSHGFGSASLRPGSFTTFNPFGQVVLNNAKPKTAKRKKGMQFKGSVKQANGPFHLDVVLLSSPDDATVPKQQPKIEVMVRGHIF